MTPVRIPLSRLIRLHGLRLSIDTIHKGLCRHGLNRLKRPRLVRKGRKRYARPIPGDRVQMDVCKMATAKKLATRATKMIISSQ